MTSPSWTKEIARGWNAGTRGVFILHGNVFDLYPLCDPGGTVGFANLKTLLAQRIFPRRRMLLFYDIADGITFATKGMQEEFMRWMETYSEATGVDFAATGKFVEALRAVRAYNSSLAAADKGTVEKQEDGISGTTLVVDFASKIIPSPSSSMSEAERRAEVSLLKFAASSAGDDMGVFLLTESLPDLSETLVRSPYVAQIRLEMPDEDEREQLLASEHIKRHTGGRAVEEWTGMTARDLARRTAGLDLRRIQNLLAEAAQAGEKPGPEYIANGKKKLIEEYLQGLVTFKEADPGKNLDNVANHSKAKEKFRQIAELVREGKHHVLEKGILIPGRIGVGKSFLVSCFSSECGMPMLELGNFRSEWVGQTEKQLAKILMVIRALGPVIVVIDEADAVLGSSREGDRGDSGIGGRVFAMLAAHIGDDRMRGREMWIAMTSRPDLLAVDMKRQGRFGLCIPLFPSQNGEETRRLFETVAMTRGMKLPEEALVAAIEAFKDHPITGSDAEAVLVRAQEQAELADRKEASREDILSSIDSFIDPLPPDLLMLQELAAVLSCSDKRFLPEKYLKADRGRLQRQMQALLAG